MSHSNSGKDEKQKNRSDSIESSKKNPQQDKKNVPHAPGAGSDKQHPETPPKDF